jgi:Lon protease-like protein
MTTIREDLPIFPLRLVLFPYEPLPLHIFEPRFRQMVADILKTDRRFGVVLAHPDIDNMETVNAPEPDTLVIAQIGTIAEILDVTTYPDGRYDILCAGRDRFEVTRTNTERPYLRASVKLLTDPNGAPSHETAAIVTALANDVRTQLLSVLARHIAEIKATDARRPYLEELVRALPETPVALEFLAARLLPTASLGERQHLLGVTGTARRLRLLKAHLRREARVAEQLGQVVSAPSSDGNECLISLN